LAIQSTGSLGSLLDKENLFGETSDLVSGDLLLLNNGGLESRIGGSDGRHKHIVLTRPTVCSQKGGSVIRFETKRRSYQYI
jgi:hypothetical protein